MLPFAASVIWTTRCLPFKLAPLIGVTVIVRVLPMIPDVSLLIVIVKLEGGGGAVEVQLAVTTTLFEGIENVVDALLELKKLTAGTDVQ